MHHKLSQSREYKCWQNLKTKCYNKNNASYKTYGARGFTVCQKWLESFCNFHEDMGDMPLNCTGIAIIGDDFREFNKLTCEWKYNSSGRPIVKQKKLRHTRPRAKIKSGVQVCLSIPKKQLDYIKSLALQMSLKCGRIVESNDLIRESIAKTYPLPCQYDIFGKKL